MILIILIMFMILCIAFCYLFYRILEIEKDIECLFDNYSKELEKSIKINLEVDRNV